MQANFLEEIAAGVDQDPVDWVPMLIYADYLEEHGSPEAEAWRWIAKRQRVPDYYHSLSLKYTWWLATTWAIEANGGEAPSHPRSYLPPKVFAEAGGVASESIGFRDYKTALDAYLCLVNALLQAKTTQL